MKTKPMFNGYKVIPGKNEHERSEMEKGLRKILRDAKNYDWNRRDIEYALKNLLHKEVIK